MDNSLNLLATRAGFNSALRHFKTVNGFAADVSAGYNLADAINAALADGSLKRNQVRAIINALLVDKLPYVYRTHNLDQTVEDIGPVVETIAKWGRIQFVLCFYDPHAGIYVINPANPEHWEGVTLLPQDEFLVLYAGSAGSDLDEKTLSSAVDDFFKVLYGKKVKDDSAYVGSRRVLKKEEPPAPPPSLPSESGSAPAEAPKPPPTSGGPRRMTPRYSVLVTNELFHNGNVEAWKRIVGSYNSKYPDLEVLIWYENERIHDINALFKWGKVKHGYPIMFSVSGENIRDVRKLQRYLYEGASPRFEAFLQGAVDRVLDLF